MSYFWLPLTGWKFRRPLTQCLFSVSLSVFLYIICLFKKKTKTVAERYVRLKLYDFYLVLHFHNFKKKMCSLLAGKFNMVPNSAGGIIILKNQVNEGMDE